MFFVIGISSCFELPCLVPECHAFGLKIATAAMRPRNDAELERFYLENGRFLFYAVVFCAVSLRIVFQTFQEIVSFSRKTHQICHCEEGACARRGNLWRNDLPSRNELWLRGTKQNHKLKREEAEWSRESMFFVIGLPFCFVLPCFATGCHAFGFKIATAAMRPRNDTELETFLH